MTEFTEPKPRRDEDDQAVVTRSEEELRITTHRRESQRARLARYVETETVTRTVEIRHDRARIDVEPISTSDGSALTRAEGAGERWMVLYDEEVVLTTRRVPRERVRLRTHTVTEDREISEAVRREQIDTASPDRPRR